MSAAPRNAKNAKKTNDVANRAPRTCADVYTFPQLNGTCWFNALIMALFYSQGMRNVIMHNMKQWRRTRGDFDYVYDTIADILINKYYRGPRRLDGEIDVLYPEHLLKALHLADRYDFEVDPNTTIQLGYSYEKYLPKLMRLLEVDSRTASLALSPAGPTAPSGSSGGSTVVVGPPLHGFRSSSNDRDYMPAYDPEVVVLSTSGSLVGLCGAAGERRIRLALKSSEPVGWLDLKGPRPHVTLDRVPGNRFVFDSVMMTNHNGQACSKLHAIAGVTCGGARYMYNGWTRYTHDVAKPVVVGRSGHSQRHACGLMGYDWLTHTGDFCINSEDCSLPGVNMAGAGTDASAGRVCFNFDKGPRTYMLVREDLYAARPEHPETPLDNSMYRLIRTQLKEECPDGWHQAKDISMCLKCPALARFSGNECQQEDVYGEWKRVPEVARITLNLKPDEARERRKEEAARRLVLEREASRKRLEKRRAAELVAREAKKQRIAEKRRKREELAKRAPTKSHAAVDAGEGFELDPVTGRRVKKCPPGSTRNPATGRCKKQLRPSSK
jgi:hypothetical protein